MAYICGIQWTTKNNNDSLNILNDIQCLEGIWNSDIGNADIMSFIKTAKA